jgi:ElaB/YqjD/DUF883 family membrane-anchored ribosome-binding protein
MSQSTACETMKEAVQQVGAKSRETVREAEDAVGQWTQKARENLQSIRNAASACVSRGQEKAGELGRTVSGKVQEWPVAALLAAASLGFLLGVVLKRR